MAPRRLTLREVDSALCAESDSILWPLTNTTRSPTSLWLHNTTVRGVLPFNPKKLSLLPTVFAIVKCTYKIFAKHLFFRKPTLHCNNYTNLLARSHFSKINFWNRSNRTRISFIFRIFLFYMYVSCMALLVFPRTQIKHEFTIQYWNVC